MFGEYKTIPDAPFGVCHWGKSYADLSEQRCISDGMAKGVGASRTVYGKSEDSVSHRSRSQSRVKDCPCCLLALSPVAGSLLLYHLFPS